MKIIILLVVFLIPVVLNGQEQRVSTASENAFIIEDSLVIPQFNRTRAIWIYLPPDYDSDDKHYPVLYMHDGQNLFEDTTSFVGEWSVDETLDSLFANGYEVPIVIGINNGGQLRIDELTPWSNEKYGGGDGDLYMQFIVETLKPEVDQRYRTLPDAQNTAIIGSSLGGLISFYGGLKYNDIFKRIGAFSPSFWYADSVYAFTESAEITKDTRILLLGSELEDSTMVLDMKKIESMIAAKVSSDNLKIVGTKDGAHSEWYWKREFPEAIIWLMELKRE